MRFRSQHIADSVTERIAAVADSITTGEPLAQDKGAATIQLQRSDNGDLMVTKTFEHGQPELMTISGNAPDPGLPAGFTDITPQNTEPAEQPLLADVADGSIVESVATGGNAQLIVDLSSEIDRVDPDLTLYGLLKIWERNRSRS